MRVAFLPPSSRSHISPGDLVYTRLLNQEVIVINSEEIARDLLERRSYNYSDRPSIIRMTNDLYVISATEHPVLA